VLPLVAISPFSIVGLSMEVSFERHQFTQSSPAQTLAKAGAHRKTFYHVRLSCIDAGYQPQNADKVLTPRRASSSELPTYVSTEGPLVPQWARAKPPVCRIRTCGPRQLRAYPSPGAIVPLSPFTLDHRQLDVGCKLVAESNKEVEEMSDTIRAAIFQSDDAEGFVDADLAAATLQVDTVEQPDGNEEVNSCPANPSKAPPVSSDRSHLISPPERRTVTYKECLAQVTEFVRSSFESKMQFTECSWPERSATEDAHGSSSNEDQDLWALPQSHRESFRRPCRSMTTVSPTAGLRSRSCTSTAFKAICREPQQPRRPESGCGYPVLLQRRANTQRDLASSKCLASVPLHQEECL